MMPTMVLVQLAALEAAKYDLIETAPANRISRKKDITFN